MLQEQTQAHREEATYAIGYVNHLTETALNKLNKQNQEQQQMAAQDERTKQRINAQRSKLRNQEQEKQSPERAKPKAKSEPNPIFKITEPLVMVTPLLMMPEQTHVTDFVQKQTQKEGLLNQIRNQKYRLSKQTHQHQNKIPNIIPKRTRTELAHIGEKHQKDI